MIGTSRPVINAYYSGNGIEIQANGVTVQGFKVVNSGSNRNAGILVKSNHTLIQNNVVQYSQAGIGLNDASNNRILENSVNNNSDGIGIESYSSNNYISFNNIVSNSDYGIYGYLSTSSTSETLANSISYNNIINNAHNTYDDMKNNEWQRNYYSDYNGQDSDGDGIGDSAYNISGSAGAKDAYPAMSLQFMPKVTVGNISDATFGSDISIPVSITNAVDLDSASYDVSFDASALQLYAVNTGLIGQNSVSVIDWSQLSAGSYRITQNIPGSARVNGNGYLAVLCFHVIGTQVENCALKVSDGALLSNLEDEIPANWIDGSVLISPPPPTITVTSPNGGESWTAGSSQNITWSSSNVTGNVKIEVSRDGGTTWTTAIASTPNDGRQTWVVTGPTTTQARIRITSVSAPTVSDTSNTNFTILAPTITIISPNGSENWLTGTTHDITWTSSNLIGNVKIEFSQNGGSSWSTLFADIPNIGSQSWTITQRATSQARIRISSVSNKNIKDTNDTNFSITVPPPTIAVIYPNGGESWTIGSTQTIMWNSTNLLASAKVKIELSRDSGSTWSTIVSSTPNTGRKTWKVIGPSTVNARIKVSSISDPSIYDISDSDFNITGPTITVTSPNGDESWNTGNQYDITWVYTNLPSSTYIKIELYKAGSFNRTINNRIMVNSSPYRWTIPQNQEPGSDYKVRISTTSGTPTISDESNGNFTIKVPTSAVTYLVAVMDEFLTSFDVYSDTDAAGNHFSCRGRMSSYGDENQILDMEETVVDNPHSGITCIKAMFKANGDNWGGWYFMNGVLQGSQTTPVPNWGSVPNAGIDLSGAQRLTFWARGMTGGECVEFFCLGVGRDAATGIAQQPYPDSSPKASTGYITLSKNWTQYTINLTGRNLSYVLGGFGWVTSADRNGRDDITFYIDDIRFDKARLTEPHFLISYETIGSNDSVDTVMRNVAFTYDNAVALIAFLASGQNERAKLLADALVYAQQHDRFYSDGRLRNAYQGGDLALPPGWTPNGRVDTVRMPGWYDSQTHQWLEDKIQVSTYTGNMAWAMLALLAYYDTNGGDQYLNAAITMGEWIESNCRDERGSGGYTAGFEGWEPNPTKLMYKATEHNIDLYSALQRLYEISGNEIWKERADHAKKFVLAMWDAIDGKFYTGTDEDGTTINESVIPVDIQAWVHLALGAAGKPYLRSLDYAETHLKYGDGFDFNQDLDGIWYEGTVHMAVAYQQTAQATKAQEIINFLEASQDTSGGLFAASKDGLTTGFDWLYYHRLHIGATAWLILAEESVNPFG